MAETSCDRGHKSAGSGEAEKRGATGGAVALYDDDDDVIDDDDDLLLESTNKVTRV